ncbi:hypothetical protein Tco_0585238 [Tanacetum coccineum]
MTTTAAQQVVLDNTLVPLKKRVKIGKCNMRIDLVKTQKQPTYQVVLDSLALTTCYPTFLITVDVQEIYMHQFWFTINKKDSTSYRFKIDKKKFTLNMKVFMEIFQIITQDEKETQETFFSLKEENSCQCRSTSVRIRDTPSVSVSNTKAPTKVARSKGIELLSDAALLEEAQLKKALKRSKRETTIHQAGDSSEGANFKSKAILLEAKTNDDEEETEDEFVHTPPNYVPTDDETNDESNDVTEEVYERINEELYGDVNIRLTDAKPDDEDKGDKEMTNAEIKDDEHENVNQEGVVVFMLDINVQHEVPRTLTLLTIPVSIIPEHNVINPSETVTTALATTISSLLTSLFPHLQQSTPIPTPTTIEATTSNIVVSKSETLAALRLRVTYLEKDVKELKDVDNSIKVISTIQAEVPKAVKEYLRSSMDDAMHKVIQKNVADIIK